MKEGGQEWRGACRSRGKLRHWGPAAPPVRMEGFQDSEAQSARREAVSRSILDDVLRLRPEGFWEACD